MLRWLFFLRYPEGVSKEEGEHWYLGTHTQEAKRLLGLRRYRSWRAQQATVAPPWTTEARLNRWDRVTELVWESWEAWHEGAVEKVPEYTPAPYGPRGFHAETIFLGEGPDDDFLGDSPAEERLPAGESERLVRWLFLLRYPETIAQDAGESWYLGTHTQEAKQMHGLRRYVSWRAQTPPPGITARSSGWDRLTELAFADQDAWVEGAVTKMPRWTPPPYGDPGFFSETVFIGERPDDDFLKESPLLP